MLGLFLLLSLFLWQQLPSTHAQRVTQVYPQPATGSPTLLTNPVPNGRYSPVGDVYIHYPFGPAGASVRILQKDGTLVYDLPQTGSNVRDFLIIGNNLYAFGQTSGIMQYALTYTLPTYMTFTTTIMPAHNYNLLRALALPSSVQVLVTTTTGGKIYKFDSSTWAVPSTINVPGLAAGTIDSIDWMPANTALVAGQNSGFGWFEYTTMTNLQSYPGDSQIAQLSYDSINDHGQSYVDFIENVGFNLKRALKSPTSLSTVLTVNIGATIDNLVAFPRVGYLMVSSGSSLKIYRRTSLTLIESFTLSGIMEPYSMPVSAGTAPNYKYLVSGALAQTTPSVRTIFSTYEINLGFCAGSSGPTCSVCFAGFQSTEPTGPNRCIMPEEYPPIYGASGRTIAPCKDPNCASCIQNYQECTLCKAGTYLNTETDQCQIITEPSLVGVDPLSPQKLRLCEDFSCLNCANNYLVCQSCPVEVFLLANGVCVSKPSSIQVTAVWFDTVNPSMVVRFSDPVTSKPHLLYPANLTFEVTDYKGANFTYLQNTKFTMEENDTVLRVSFDLTASIYNATITVTQLSDVPQFYNSRAYLSKGQEFTIKRARLIKSELYYKVNDWDSWLAYAVWGVSIIQLVIGIFGDSEKATTLLRGCATLGLICHLNGPILHVGDTFVGIVGRNSVPLISRDIFASLGQASASSCYPGDNFQKVPFLKVSCSVLQNYGASILWFVCTMFIPIVFSMVAHAAWNKHNQQTLTNPGYVPSGRLAKILVLERYLGSRFAVSIFWACLPMSLQFAVVNLNSTTKVTFDTPISAFMLLVSAILLISMMKFTINFLDKQNLIMLKKNHISLSQNGDLKDSQTTFSKGSSLKSDNEDGLVDASKMNGPKPVALVDSQKGSISVSIPPKNKVVPLSHEGMKRKLNKLQKLGDTHFSRDIPSASAVGQSSPAYDEASRADQRDYDNSLDNSNLPVHDSTSQVERPEKPNENLPSHRTVVLRANCAFVGYPLLRFKGTPRTSYSPIYFLPVIEFVKIILQCLALVRFADRGMTQIYAVGVFELLVLVLYLFARPFESAIDHVLFATEKLLVCGLMTIKLLNFLNIKEEEQRQQILDIWLFYLAVVFVAFCAVVGIFGIVQGLSKIFCFSAEVQDEMRLLVEDCTQFSQIENAIVDFTKKAMKMPISNVAHVQPQADFKAPINEDQEIQRELDPLPKLAVSQVAEQSVWQEGNKSTMRGKMALMISKQLPVPTIKLSGVQNSSHKDNKIKPDNAHQELLPQTSAKNDFDSERAGGKLRSDDGDSNFSKSQGGSSEDEQNKETNPSGFKPRLGNPVPNYKGVDFLDVNALNKVRSSDPKNQLHVKRSPKMSKLMKEISASTPENPEESLNRSSDQPRVFAYKSRAGNLQNLQWSQPHEH